MDIKTLIKKCFRMTSKRPCLFSKKTTRPFRVKAISSLGRPHPRQSILHPEQIKMEKIVSSMSYWNICDPICPDSWIFPKGKTFREGPRGQQNPNGWASAIDKQGISNVDESIMQNAPRWWRHCKLPRCLNDMTVESLHYFIWLFRFIRLITKDAPHQLHSLWQIWRQAQEKGTFWQMTVFGCFCWWENGFLKNPLHLQATGGRMLRWHFAEKTSFPTVVSQL